MAVTEGILVLALSAIVSGLVPASVQWNLPTLQSPRDVFGSPTAPAVLPRPARPGAEMNR